MKAIMMHKINHDFFTINEKRDDEATLTSEKNWTYCDKYHSTWLCNVLMIVANVIHSVTWFFCSKISFFFNLRAHVHFFHFFYQFSIDSFNFQNAEWTIMLKKFFRCVFEFQHCDNRIFFSRFLQCIIAHTLARNFHLLIQKTKNWWMILRMKLNDRIRIDHRDAQNSMNENREWNEW